MNYISQIRAFYDALLVRPLSAGQIALWHGLMDRCNRLGWPEWFTAANISLESSCSLSRKGIYDSRNSLKQAGLIDFRSNGTKAASYKIIVLYSTQDTAQVSTQANTQDTTQVTATLLKPKQKPKQEIRDARKEKLCFGEFEHVRMTEGEYAKLTAKYPEELVEDKVAYLDSNIQAGVKKYLGYKDHYATIGNWCRMDAGTTAKAEEAPAVIHHIPTERPRLTEGMTWQDMDV